VLLLASDAAAVEGLRSAKDLAGLVPFEAEEARAAARRRRGHPSGGTTGLRAARAWQQLTVQPRECRGWLRLANGLVGAVLDMVACTESPVCPRPLHRHPPGRHFFGGFKVMEHPGLTPAPALALALLQRLACDPAIAAVMSRRGWRVGLLSEMPPEGKVGVSAVCVLGYNVNQVGRGDPPPVVAGWPGRPQTPAGWVWRGVVAVQGHMVVMASPTPLTPPWLIPHGRHLPPPTPFMSILPNPC
jgi:hypothetical protein